MNDGTVPLTAVVITDPSLTGLTCTPAMPADLAVGESIRCTGTYTTSPADVASGHVLNLAGAASGETEALPAEASLVQLPATDSPWAGGSPRDSGLLQAFLVVAALLAAIVVLTPTRRLRPSRRRPASR